MLPIDSGRRTQVVKGEVCKTSMQRFESARRLQILIDFIDNSNPRLLPQKKSSGLVYPIMNVHYFALIGSFATIVNQLKFFC